MDIDGNVISLNPGTMFAVVPGESHEVALSSPLRSPYLVFQFIHIVTPCFLAVILVFSTLLDQNLLSDVLEYVGTKYSCH